MKKILVIAVLCAFAVPAAFAAPPVGKGKPTTGPSTTGPSTSSSSGQGSAALCKEQRRTMGMSAFRSLYAPGGSPKAAFDACLAKVSAQVVTETKNAAMDCKAERARDPDAFAKRYGTNANLRNAFGKCVSGKATDETEQQQQETLNAAKQCKAERGTTVDSMKTFANKYGTNANKRNAFGKCVSAKAKAQGKGKDDSGEGDDDSGD